jgi:SNF2 family DNA or RNA helicase
LATTGETPASSRKKRRLSNTPHSTTKRQKTSNSKRSLKAKKKAKENDQRVNWKEEIDKPLKWLQLKQISETYDIKDPWWQNKFIVHAQATMNELLQRQDAVNGVLDEKETTVNLAQPMPADDAIELGAHDPAAFDTNQAEEDSSDEKDDPVGHQPALFNDLQNLLAEGDLWADELAQHEKANQAKLDRDEECDGNNFVSGMGKVITPTQDHVDLFSRQEKWADDMDLQRDNTEEAYLNLGILPNANPPKMPGMRPNIALEHWQPLVANAMLESLKDPLLTGHLNADDVGLGKTFEAIAFLLKVSNSMARLRKLSPGANTI